MVRWARLCLLTGAFLLAFWAVSLPTPSLFAGVVAALILAVASGRIPVLPGPLGKSGHAVLGVSVCTQLDWAAFRSVGSDGAVLVGVIVATLVVSVASGQLLRLRKVDAVTATLSGVAGGATGMVAMARELGADDRIVMTVQYLRVLFVLLTLPLVVTVVFASVEGHPEVAASGGDTAGNLRDYLFVALAVVVGVYAGRVARLPSPSLLGPLAVGIALGSLPAFANASVPDWLRGGALLVLGVQVGLRFTGESLRVIARILPMALVMTALSVVACAALGILLAGITGESLLDSYLATSPGGFPVVLATATGMAENVTFVTAGQSARLLAALVLIPVGIRLASVVAGRRSGSD